MQQPLSQNRRLAIQAALLCSTTVLPLIIGKLCIPMDRYAFRCWESLRDAYPACHEARPFYPNQVCDKIEVGEIGLRSPYEITKRVHWVTDAYGFRNAPAVAEESTAGSIQIVMVGDSSVAGAALSQEATLPVVLSTRLDKTVYSYAPERMATFLKDPRFTTSPPTMVIYVGVVSHLFKILEPLRLGLRPDTNSQPWAPLAKRFYCGFVPESWRITLEHIQKKPLINQHLYKLLTQQVSTPLIADKASGMVFYHAALEQMQRYHENPEGYVRHVTNTLIEYRDALAKRDIQFLFVLVPDKEILYWERIPAQYKPEINPSSFSDTLLAQLRKAGVPAIDVASAFRRVQQSEGTLLYHLDDTHWNADGVSVTADFIREQLASAHAL